MTLLQNNLQDLQLLVNNVDYVDIQLDDMIAFPNKVLDYVSQCKVYKGTTPIANKFFQTVTASNTELHLKKGSKNCLVVTGESWTYGDRLMENNNIRVRSLDGTDDIYYRLNNIFAGHCARILQSDLYLSAVPGNSNTGIVCHLPNILHYLKKYDYEKIYVIVQMTSPGRCMGDSRWREDTEYWNNFMGNALGVDKPKNNVYTKNMITLDQWYDLYEYGMCDLINAHCNHHGVEDVIVWRNFNPVRNKDLPCKMADRSWVQFLAKLYNYNFDHPNCNEAQWFEDLHTIFAMEDVGHERKMKELDAIEQSNTFIQQSPLNEWHPQSTAHYMWAINLLKQAGWWNEV